MNTAAKIVVYLGLALGAGACNFGGEHPEMWQTQELGAPSENVMWTVVAQELDHLDFPVGTDVDPVTLTMETGWRLQLAPFRGEGYREKAFVRLRGLEGGRYEVEARVARENNMDMVRPLDLGHAKWEPVGDDVEMTQLLLQRVLARVGSELEVGPAPKKRSR